MTSEGGGKLRQKKSRVGAKPYDRSKSLVGRLKEAVVGILNPSWVSSFVPWSEPAVAAERPRATPAEDSNDHRERDVKRKSCLNVGATSSPNNNVSSANIATRINSKAKIPLDNSAFFRTNHDRETFDLETHHVVSGPSTSTPLAASTSSSYSQALANAREFAAARRRKGVGSPSATATEVLSAENRNEEPQQQQLQPPPSLVVVESARRVAPVASTAANNKMFAKLSDFSKLNEVSAINQKSYNTNCDSNSECSEESMSTSGCSSMVPHPDKREYQREVIQMGKSVLNSIDEQLPDGVASPASFSDTKTWGFSSELSERRSKSLLWPDSVHQHRSTTKPQQTATGSRPQFNPSLLGTSLWSESRSMTGKSAVSKAESPYLGKVTYGFGPPTAKRARSCASTPYTLESSSRPSAKAKVQQNGNDYVMSSTAKRILLTLEKMSTPVTDAKKIPTNSVLSPALESPLTFNTTARRRPNLSNRKLAADSNNSAVRSLSVPPTQRLLTPQLNITRTIHSRQENAASVSSVPQQTQLDSSNTDQVHRLSTMSNADSYFPSKSDSRAGGKIRARTEPMHYSSAAASKDEVVEMPKLPAVSLSIQNLPVFDLIPSKPKPSMASLSTPKSNIGFPTNKESSKLPSTTPTVPTFTFSTPVVKQDVSSVNGNNNSQVLSSQLPNFQFHSPANEVKANDDARPSFVSSTSPTNAKLLKRKPQNDVENASTHVPSVVVASELKTGSVMDILGKLASTKPATTGFGDKFRPAEGSWNCPDCFINNKGDVTKCVACGHVKANAKPAAVAPSASATTTAASSSWGEKFRPAAGTWECPGCMLRVPASSEKCAACETPKPKSGGSMAATSLTGSVTTFDGLGATSTAVTSSKLKLPLADDGKWECDICLVKNECNAQKCVACETLKRKPIQPSAVSSSGFKFNVPLTTTTTTSISTNLPFKFGLSAATSSAVTSSSVTGSNFKFGFGSSADTTTLGTTANAVTSGSTPTTFSFSKTTKEISSAEENPVVTSSTAVSTAVSSTTTTASSSTVNSGFKFGFTPSNNLVTSSTKPAAPAPSLVAATAASTTTSTLPTPSTVTEQSEATPTSTTTTATSSTLTSFVTNTTPFGSVVSSTTTSSATSVQTTKSDVFIFGAKPSPLAVTTAATTSVATPASAARDVAGGFSFSFTAPGGSKQPSSFAFTPTTTAAAAVTNDLIMKMPQSSFGSGISALTASTAAPTSSSGTFSFAFGGGTRSGGIKRGSSGNDEPDVGKNMIFGSVSSSEKQKLGFASPAPVFGALSTVSDKSPASSTFTFGTAAPAQSTTPVFGSLDSSLKMTTPTFGASSTPSLTFGSSAPVSTQPTLSVPTFGSTATSAQQPFVFGASNSIATTSSSNASQQLNSTTFGAAGVSAAQVAFGNGGFGRLGGGSGGTVVTTQQPSSGFTFGASAASASSASTTTTSTPASSTFTFGAAQPAAQPTMFSFNANQQPPLPGFNFNPAQPPTFNFGAVNPVNPMPNQNQAFQFSANPFDAHSTVGQVNRVVRKARRRNNDFSDQKKNSSDRIGGRSDLRNLVSIIFVVDSDAMLCYKIAKPELTIDDEYKRVFSVGNNIYLISYNVYKRIRLAALSSETLECRQIIPDTGENHEIKNYLLSNDDIKNEFVTMYIHYVNNEILIYIYCNSYCEPDKLHRINTITWEVKEFLLENIYGLTCACFVNNRIYGIQLENWQLNVSYLDLKKLKWTTLSKGKTSPTAYVPYDSVAYGNEIYTFRGVRQIGVVSNAVFAYNTLTNKWKTISSGWTDIPCDDIHSGFIKDDQLVIIAKTVGHLGRLYFKIFSFKTLQWTSTIVFPNPLSHIGRFAGGCFTNNKIFVVENGASRAKYSSVKSIVEPNNYNPKVYVLDLLPSLQTLCEVTVFKHSLDTSKLPKTLQNKLQQLLAKTCAISRVHEVNSQDTK
ncbi:E3 SUMO-protein ligase RanBP2 [Chamberlinius hualienensis]